VVSYKHYMKFTVIIAVISFLSVTQNLHANTATIAIISDGHSVNGQHNIDLLKVEINKLLEGEYQTTYIDGPEFDGQWSLPRLQKIFTATQRRSDIDVIIAHGPVASHVAINSVLLPKPTIATLFFNSDLQTVPRKGKTSGKTNLTYIQHEKSFLKDITLYQSIVPFKKLALIGDESMTQVDEFNALLKKATKRVSEDGMELLFIPVADNVNTLINRINSLVSAEDAVYLLPNERLTSAQLDTLGAELIKRNIPAFAMQDSRVIEHGFLAVYSHENTFKRERRRVALNIRDILDGVPASELNVFVEIDHQLYINQQTVDALGIDLTWTILQKSELVNKASDDIATLSLSAIANIALDNNLEIKAERRALAASLGDVDIAKASRLPKMTLDLQHTTIDRDRAEFSNGSSAERDLSASLTVQQVIYNEAVWSNVSTQEHLQRARVYDFQTKELDVTEEAALAYVNILRAQSLVDIENSNLSLTKANLNRALRRVEAGVARKSEIYRWQSQAADNERSLLNAQASLQNSFLNINQLINQPLDTLFTVDKLDKQHAIFDFNRKVTTRYLTGPSSLEKFSKKSESYARKTSPEIKSVEENILAQERQLKASKRQYYVPDVSVQASLKEHVDKAGEGDRYPDAVGINDTDASIAVVLSLPLYSGGERRAEVSQLSNRVHQLRYQKSSTEIKIQQRVRSTFNQLAASYPGIGLSESALSAAKQNYNIVRDSYERGTVSIVDFLDAQNQVFSAERSAANAIYDYLDDYIRYQRSIGYFFYFDDPKGIYSLLFDDASVPGATQ